MPLHAYAHFSQFLDPAPHLLPRHPNFLSDLRPADHNRRILSQQSKQRVQTPVGSPRQISHPFSSHMNCSASKIPVAVKGDRAPSDVRSRVGPAYPSNPPKFSPEPYSKKFHPPAALSSTQYPWPAARFPSSTAKSPPACRPPRPLNQDAPKKSPAPKDSPNAAKAPGSIPLASALRRRS